VDSLQYQREGKEKKKSLQSMGARGREKETPSREKGANEIRLRKSSRKGEKKRGRRVALGRKPTHGSWGGKRTIPLSQKTTPPICPRKKGGSDKIGKKNARPSEGGQKEKRKYKPRRLGVGNT